MERQLRPEGKANAQASTGTSNKKITRFKILDYPTGGMEFSRWSVKTSTMRKIILTAIISIFLIACGTSDTDSVKQAHEKNVNSGIDEDVSKFLTEAADARMMDLEQGKLAMSKGTTAEIREYGQWMVKDQTRMLKDLRVLAASKKITIPSALSDQKSDGLEELKKKEGEEFDKKFLNMMTIDHRRDVNDFDKATKLKDADIKQFASTNLTTVKSHLERIKTLEESRTVAEGKSGEESL
jgi:putative membrane protein